MPPHLRFRSRRPPAWVLVIGVLVALTGVAWAVKEGPPAPPAGDAGDAAGLTAPAAPGLGDGSDAPEPPRVTPERREMARMSASRVAATNGGGRRRLVALTFDDGPGPLTMRFLSVLARLDVPATFYVQGGEAERDPAALRAMVAGGHEIGVHGWNHADLTGADTRTMLREVFTARATIAGISGVAPGTLRPPYGGVDARVLRVAATARLMTVLWDVDTEDWRGRDAGGIARHVLAEATAGSIVLMHDGGGDRRATLRALPAVVAGLRRRGLELVTVGELLMRDPPRDLRRAAVPAGTGTGADGALSAPGPAPPSAGGEPGAGG